MGSFLIGNGLMIVAGAWCAIVYQQADIVEVLILQGLSVAAVIMLCLNLLTIQAPPSITSPPQPAICCAANVAGR